MRALKKLLPIIGLLVVLGASIGLYMYAKHSSDKKEVEEKPVETTIFSCEEEDLTQISYKIQDKDEITLVKDSDTWIIKDNEDAPVNTLNLNQMIVDSREIVAKSIITEKNEEDLAEFGLDNPASIISIKTGSEEVTLYVGDESISAGGRYAYTEDKPERLFIVATTYFADFNYDLSQMIQTESLPELTSDNIVYFKSEKKDGKALEISRNDVKEFTSFSSWKVEEPLDYAVPGDDQYIPNLLNLLQKLALEECTVFDAKEEDYEKYELDKPNYTITIEYKDVDSGDSKELIIKVGKFKKDKYYISLSDYNNIYYTSLEIIKAILEPPYETYMCRTFLASADITELKELKLIKDDKEADYKLTYNSEKDEFDVDTVSGKKLDSKGILEEHDKILNIKINGLIKKEKIKDENFSFDNYEDFCCGKIVATYEDYEVEVDFYPYDGVNFYMVGFDGKKPQVVVDMNITDAALKVAE
ncbi:MAG: DUF4340 domain-containing protein [Lachnospiraceae bacterium]|nr:DUF4340 domain-containing protein [Lachnospiraceae bacterium]